MKASARIAVIAFIAFIAATGTALAQDWTKAQKEVWQVVEDTWTKWKAGDIDGMAVYLHEKYQGWNNDQPLPLSKEQVIKYYKELYGTSKIESVYLNAARIAMTDNAAVVDYYFSFSEVTTTGDKKTVKEYYGKNAEFYVKEGGKWLLLGDNTFVNESKPQ